MNVTSILSDGYLRPANVSDISRREIEAIEKTRAPSAEFSQEQQVLAQEQRLRNAHGPDARVSTTYRYSVGADGRRYISGAYVSIEASEPDEQNGARAGSGDNRQAGVDENNTGENRAGNNNLSPEEEAVVRELQRAEQEVVAHEAAHQAAGGGLAGAASYSYTQGPDGRHYITGGEVPIQMPVSNDPEQTLRDMAKVQRAALAPGNPSPQDVRVASQAAAKAAGAMQELNSRRISELSGEGEGNSAFSSGPSGLSGIESIRAGLLFERIQFGRVQEEGDAEDFPYNTMNLIEEAYSRNASDQGLWTLRYGFEQTEQMPGMWQEPRLNVAA